MITTDKKVTRVTAKQTTIVLARAGVIAALYAALTIAFSFTSFATYTVQFRVSEVLTVLPLFFAEAVPGLWIGCMLGNIISGNVVDIFFGSLATLIAAGLTFLIGKLVRGRLLRILLGILPPVFVNMFMVPMTYTLFAGEPAAYWLQTVFVLAGQAGVLVILGIPFALAFEKRVWRILTKGGHMKKDDAKRNAKGQTLEEFLAAYDPKKYRHPAVTADCVIFSGDRVLLVRRGNHPYIGELAFPGGFCEAGESTEQTAARELREETGAEGALVRQFYTASRPGRDPRDWTISVCYTAELSSEISVSGGDDAASAAWYAYEVTGNDDDKMITLTSPDGETVRTALRVVRDAFGKVDVNATVETLHGMAFDHAIILLRAIEER